MMPDSEMIKERTMGLWEATSLGVGAIVGGGILALAGVAFATTGPSAILAFVLNGMLAFLTALSFAKLATMFPQSGGTYTYAKRILSVEAAFYIGWIVWFASIAAGVLYSVGFGYFTAVFVSECWQVLFGHAPAWLISRPVVMALGIGAIVYYAFRLMCKLGGGGAHWENIGKLALFIILIVAGVVALMGRSTGMIRASMTPFFSGGAMGLFQAMGFTFIALQGFDLIAAAGGEIRNPTRTIPRAMYLSLGIALLVYLPLLFTMTAAGLEPGESITSVSRDHPEEIVAIAAKRFLGVSGFWLVLVAAMLSMLSALRANMFAASRVAMAMARDRTMPYPLASTHRLRGTPVAAILATAVLIVGVVVVLPDVSAAGAASSLIFLITFAAAHWITILAHRRRYAGLGSSRRTKFPLLPTAGMICCIMLAVYQGVMVASAGIVSAIWLAIGGLLFMGLFARPARIVDASAEAQDPELLRLRGRTPLVLAPIANPANTEAMMAVANALTPPKVGRVLLLSVAVSSKDGEADDDVSAVRHAQAVLGDALIASLKIGIVPEALATVATNPWQEISRIALEHRCESLLVGLTEFKPDASEFPLDDLLSTTQCEVLILRAATGWRLSDVHEILVPVGGHGWHDRLRARLLGSLFRTGERRVTFLRVVPEGTSPATVARVRQALSRIARDEAPGRSRVEVAIHDDVAQAVMEHAGQNHLVILGTEHTHRRRRVGFGQMTLRIARESETPILIISHHE